MEVGPWSTALDRQRRLQDCLARVQGVTPTREQLLLALKVETGELLQRVKARWAWWRRNDRRFDRGERAAVLEEIADMMHFVLGAVLLSEEDRVYVERASCGSKPRYTDRSLVEVANRLFEARAPAALFTATLELAGALGFSPREILEAYLAKSRVNLERWDATGCAESA